jgi:hypothetical protein
MNQIRFTTHALEEMRRRGITQEQVKAVLANPGQILPGRNQRMIYQSKMELGSGKPYLLRVFVDERESPSLVITVYRTSKIQKYWRMP